MWQIIDDNGIIYSGKEEEIRQTFYEIIEGHRYTRWEGDLKLIEVHEVYR